MKAADKVIARGKKSLNAQTFRSSCTDPSMGCRDGLAQPSEGIPPRHRWALAVLDFVQHRRQSISKDSKRLALDFLGPVRCDQEVATQREQRRWGRAAQPPSSAINRSWRTRWPAPAPAQSRPDPARPRRKLPAKPALLPTARRPSPEPGPARAARGAVCLNRALRILKLRHSSNHGGSR